MRPEHLSHQRFSRTRNKQLKQRTKERNKSSSHPFHNIRHPWIIRMERISLPPHLHVFPDFSHVDAYPDQKTEFLSPTQQLPAEDFQE